MAGRPLILRPVKVTVCLPQDLHARLMLHLYSPSEGRIPKGDIAKFIVERLNEFFSKGPPNANP